MAGGKRIRGKEEKGRLAVRGKAGDRVLGEQGWDTINIEFYGPSPVVVFFPLRGFGSAERG